MQGSILHQPVKDNFVYNNQQKLVFLESSVLDYESSAFRYKKYIAVLKSGKRFEQPKMKDTCWVVLRLFIIVCSWDPIMTGFMKKSLRFKTRKMNEAICFLLTLPSMGECSHCWCDVGNYQYLLFLVISFGYSTRESSSLFFVGFIVVLEDLYTSVVCDFGDICAWIFVCFLQLADCCFSCIMIRKLFSHLPHG